MSDGVVVKVKRLLSQITVDRAVELGGTLLAMTGAIMVAHMVHVGWFFYLAANALLVVLFVRKRLWFLMALTFVFIYADLIGIKNYFIGS